MGTDDEPVIASSSSSDEPVVVASSDEPVVIASSSSDETVVVASSDEPVAVASSSSSDEICDKDTTRKLMQMLNFRSEHETQQWCASVVAHLLTCRNQPNPNGDESQPPADWMLTAQAERRRIHAQFERRQRQLEQTPNNGQ